ncbi:hypothetical protein CW613_003986 [Vibrio mimicus]
MKSVEKIMMILKVEQNGQAMFSSDSVNWKKIDEITKEDISLMLDICIDNDVLLEDSNMEKITHPAQKIIYKSIYDKFKSFINDKPNFLSQIDNLYKDALNKYKNDN